MYTFSTMIGSHPILSRNANTVRTSLQFENFWTGGIIHRFVTQVSSALR
jgi:hypothetical protein